MGPIFWGCHVFLSLCYSSSTVPAGSRVYKSSLGAIPCTPYVHDHKINISSRNPLTYPLESLSVTLPSVTVILKLGWNSLTHSRLLSPSNQHMVQGDLAHRIQKGRLLLSAVYQVRPALHYLAASNNWTRASGILFAVDSLISLLTHMQKCSQSRSAWYSVKLFDSLCEFNTLSAFKNLSF